MHRALPALAAVLALSSCAPEPASHPEAAPEPSLPGALEGEVRWSGSASGPVIVQAFALEEGEGGRVRRISKADVLAAKAQGFRYKLIGRTALADGKIEASVAPVKLPLSDPLAGVMGAHNALTFDTDLMGKITIQGAGAGKIETGFAILSDILAVHRC